MNSLHVWKEKVNVEFKLGNWIYVYKNSYKDVRMVFGKKIANGGYWYNSFFCATNVFENNFVYLMSGYF